MVTVADGLGGGSGSSDLLILSADKGRPTVLLDRADYDKKLQDVLDDTSTYKRLQKDPTPSLERRMNSMLLKLHKEDRGGFRILCKGGPKGGARKIRCSY